MVCLVLQKPMIDIKIPTMIQEVFGNQQIVQLGQL